MASLIFFTTSTVSLKIRWNTIPTNVNMENMLLSCRMYWLIGSAGVLLSVVHICLSGLQAGLLYKTTLGGFSPEA